MIFPIWQSLASSSHLLSERIGQVLHEETTHTGTLDPMAEGVLVILSGEDRYAKGNLSDWDKTYEFSILWGIQTDSFDQLGIIQMIDPVQVDNERLQAVLRNFPTSYEQLTPMYSSLRFEGKSGFDWAREGREIPSKKRLVQIFAIEMVNIESLSWQEIQTQQSERVMNVEGDFRQTEIVNSWKDQHVPVDRMFLVTHHRVTVSTGTYIRQLVQDIAKEVGIPATTWSITRTRNGPYEKQDCVETDELY